MKKLLLLLMFAQSALAQFGLPTDSNDLTVSIRPSECYASDTIKTCLQVQNQNIVDNFNVKVLFRTKDHPSDHYLLNMIPASTLHPSVSLNYTSLGVELEIDTLLSGVSQEVCFLEKISTTQANHQITNSAVILDYENCHLIVPDLGCSRVGDFDLTNNATHETYYLDSLCLHPNPKSEISVKFTDNSCLGTGQMRSCFEVSNLSNLWEGPVEVAFYPPIESVPATFSGMNSNRISNLHTVNNGVEVFTIDHMTPNETLGFCFDFKVDANTRLNAMWVYVHFQDWRTESNRDNNSDTLSNQWPDSCFTSIHRKYAVGGDGALAIGTGSITYKIEYSNTTNHTVNEVRIKDQLDPNYFIGNWISDVSGQPSNPWHTINNGAIDFSVTTNLQPGETGYVQFKAYLIDSLQFRDTLRNKAQICFDQDSTCAWTNTALNYGGWGPSATESILQAGWRISPNPAKGIIHLDFGTHEKNIRFIQIIDVSGRTCKRIHVPADGKDQLEIDLTDLPAGIYLMTDDRGNNRRLMINK